MAESGRQRAYAVALLVLVVGSALLLVAYGLTWARADVPLLAGSADAVRSRDLTGRDLFPWAAMAGWVGLAAVAGIVATRAWGRIVVAVVGVLAGLVGAGAALLFAVSPSTAVDQALTAQAGMPMTVPSQGTAAWLLALVAGIVVAGAGVWTVLRGRSWPSLGRRYERSSSGRREVSDWEAQDLGQDPTDDLVE